MKRIGNFLDRFLRLLFRIAVYLLAGGLIVLGAHGIYVYASKIEVIFGAHSHELFLTMNVLPMRDLIGWMSTKGLESWIIPTAFIVGGIIIWKFEVELEYFVFRKILATFKV